MGTDWYGEVGIKLRKPMEEADVVRFRNWVENVDDLGAATPEMAKEGVEFIDLEWHDGARFQDLDVQMAAFVMYALPYGCKGSGFLESSEAGDNRYKIEITSTGATVYGGTFMFEDGTCYDGMPNALRGLLDAIDRLPMPTPSELHQVKFFADMIRKANA